MMTSGLAVVLVHSLNLSFTNTSLSDPSNPDSVFETPRVIRQTEVKEGQDFLLRCLLTDPSVSNLTLQSVGDTSGTGQGLPPGMTVTFDPKRGALIRGLQRTFTGYYVCSGWKDGRQFRSKPVELPACKTCLPAYLYDCLYTCSLATFHLSVFVSTYLSVCLSVHLQGHMFVPLSLSVRKSPSVYRERNLRSRVGPEAPATCLISPGRTPR